MLTIYAQILRSGTVTEFRDLCIYFTNAYNALYAFDWAIADYQTQPPRSRSLRIISDFASVVPPSDYLKSPQMWLSTGNWPGYIQYCGKDNALATLRDYAGQAFWYRQQPGFNPSQLANVKTSLIQPRVNSMVALGISSSQRDDAVATYFINPMLGVDIIQGVGFLGASWTA